MIISALTLAILLAGADDVDEPLPTSLIQEPKPAPAESKLPWRTFEFMFGATYNSVSSTVLLGRSAGNANLEIDGEGILGLSRTRLSPEVWTAYRLGDRHRITFQFRDLSRSSTHTLQRDITVDDTTYTVGTTIHSVFGVQFFNLGYAWSFLQDERVDVALTFGVDMIRTHFAIDGGQITEDERFTFPIPLPGLNVDVVLIGDLWLRQRLQFMYIPVQNYAGLFIDFTLALEYSFLRNLSLGVGCDLMRIGLEKQSSDTTLGDFDGAFKFSSAGFLLYLDVHY